MKSRELLGWFKDRTMSPAKAEYVWQRPLRFQRQRKRFSGSEIQSTQCLLAVRGRTRVKIQSDETNGYCKHWLKTWVPLNVLHECWTEWWAEKSPCFKIIELHKLPCCCDARTSTFKHFKIFPSEPAESHLGTMELQKSTSRTKRYVLSHFRFY